MLRRLIFSFTVLFVLILGASGCSNPKPPAAATLPPTAPVVPTPTPSPTSTPTIAPTKALTAADLVPMYRVSDTVSLTEADIYPALDVMTSAEQDLRDLGFGETLDQLTDELLTYGGRDFEFRAHNLKPYLGFTITDTQPVYTLYIYDQTCDCLLVPYVITDAKGSRTSARSGDTSELADLIAQHGTQNLGFATLAIPTGLSDGGEIRLVAAKTGIVPGAFYNKTTFLGWYDFDSGQWQLTQSARTYLEMMYAMQNTQSVLEENLANWVSGTTVIPSSELFEERPGKPRPFNSFDRNQQAKADSSARFYGVVLGMLVKEESLFVLTGFEDVKGLRYYLPINVGKVTDATCGADFGSISSNLGEFHYYLDQFTYYQCDVLRLVLGNFLNKPMLIEQQNGPGDYPLEFTRYIFRSAANPLGSNTFDERINPTLDKVTAENYPVTRVRFFIRK